MRTPLSSGFLRGTIAAFVLCVGQHAHGDIIVQSISIGTGTMTAPGTSIATPSLELFDPTLGELNFVDIGITGLLILQVEFVPIILPPPEPPPEQLVMATLTQQLDGLIGGNFDFELTPQVLVQHAAEQGIIVSQVISGYAFRFDETSDALGFATVSGGSSAVGPLTTFVLTTPSLAFGTRDEFIDTLGIGSTLYFSSWSSTYTSMSGFNPMTFTYAGNMMVTYDYTPFDTVPDGENPVEVAEPATWLLLLIGCSMLLLNRGGRTPRAGGRS